jgi:hypothetical protein
MMKIMGLWLMALLLAGCISSKEKAQNQTIDQLELQEDVQRFYTRFTQRVIEAGHQSKGLMTEHRMTALREYLLYDSESLKIAVSPFPQLNLMDMMVFVKLNRMVIEDYWIPEVYGQSGVPLLQAFLDSEEDIEQIALKAMDEKRLKKIEHYIATWRSEHPNDVRVEKIRLADFSKYAKVDESKGFFFSLSNLIVDTKSAVEAADQMALVANRGIFLAQHIPLIVRLNARVGAQEMIEETVNQFQSAPQLMSEIKGNEPLINNLVNLVTQADFLVKDTSALMKSFPGQFPEGINVNKTLDQLILMITKTDDLLKKIETSHPQRQEAFREMKHELRDMIWFLALVIVSVGVVISLVWWSGAYVCKRALLKRSES